MLAGGSGTRLGAGRNKVFLPLGEGRTVLGWSLRAFTEHPEIGPVVLVARVEDHALVEREVDGTRVEVVAGGATRQDSELCGLRHLAARIAADEIDTVLVHDGARPLVTAALVAAVLAAARADGGAVPGLRRDDLAAVAADGVSLRWPPGGGDARGLVAVQTPQGFRAKPLLAAYEQAQREGFVGTDTASCVQRYTDLPVRWVVGDERNFKITYAHDVGLAEHAAARR